jgi:hypothetical protein
MMRFVGTILLAACLMAPAQAQNGASPEALQAAKELAAVMTGDTVTQVSHALTTQIWPTIENRFAPKVDKATLAELRAEFERSVAEFSGETMKDAPAVYAKYFSVQELHDMLAFYRSPTGAKALKVMPQVLADVSIQMQPRMQEFQRALNERVAAVMRKHGYAK